MLLVLSFDSCFFKCSCIRFFIMLCYVSCLVTVLIITAQHDTLTVENETGAEIDRVIERGMRVRDPGLLT